MSLQRLLQITIGVMAAYGTLLLGLGQGNALMPLIAAVVAVTSVYFTDIRGVIRLNRFWATLAALGAMGLALADFSRLRADSQLLAIADLLMYLQVVLMYQKKDVRIYWQLIMLSFLQVVVATALSYSLYFGLLLMGFFFLSFYVLTLFFAYRESLLCQPDEAKPTTERARTQSTPSGWSGFKPAAREDLSRARLGRDFIPHVLEVGAVTLLVTFLVFFLVPKVGKGGLFRRAITVQSTIGFSEKVELGKLGEAFQDPASVMRVWFTEAATDRPYLMSGDPLFRGAIVDKYLRGAWSLKSSERNPGGGEVRDLLEPPRSAVQVVAERIVLEPQTKTTVFSVFPAYRLGRTSPIEEQPLRQQLVRKNPNERLEFVLATTAFEYSTQRELIPNTRDTPELSSDERMILTQFPAAQLPNLKQFAADKLSKFGSASDPIGKAKALQQALLNADRFQYSLASQRRNLRLDPIEDFISEHPQGHCEYFSSALTLMLRSQDIPARMIIGFKGGEYNSLGNYYQVRNLHAHTWVEAYIDGKFMPPDSQGRRPSGGWLRLDPTPGSVEGEGNGELTLAQQARDWMNYGDYLWTNYVVGLDSKRQDESIYGPLATAIRSARAIFARKTWTETIPQAIRSLFSWRTWVWLKQNYLSWPMLLFFSIAVLATLWIRRLVRGIRRRVKTRRPVQQRRLARSDVVVSFYQRLEALLARQGMVRPQSQTQHEFAMAVAGQLVESSHLAPVAGLPRRVVDAFYRIRFGRHSLDKLQIEQVEQAIRDLATALNAS